MKPPQQTPKNLYHIGGIPVSFPYKPYGSQLAFMARVISTLDRAQRDGHCHALLESPTGTGKSLSLLCSALAWQSHRQLNPIPAVSLPDPRAESDPLHHGGGFVADDSQLSETSTPEAAPPTANGKSEKKKKKAVPTIYYASRTHSQISQVIREYRKTTYRVPMAVLASRKHYCTNARVQDADNLDEECKLLLEDRDNGCSQFKNLHKVKCHPSLQKGGCSEAHDIEDLVKIGKRVKGCSYYAARSMAEDAQIVFCPYSYIINPVIRRAMEVDIKGAILFLDEAHNIEDMSRDAGSVNVDEEALLKLQTELGQLCGEDALTYQPLYEMIQDIISWLERRKTSLEKREFQHYFSSWTGDKALRELQEANISQQCFPILQECAVKAIKASSDTESGLPHLSGMSAITLEGLFCSLSYFFQGNGAHFHDYQLVVQRFVKKTPEDTSGSWILTLSLWCLNPAVVFRDIAELSMSVILTSGTLSPMSSFSSELGISFGTMLEAPHVIDVESQVWTSVISTGPYNYPLNASYKTADGYAFQDAVGKSLEELFRVIPGGSLVFFPSYKLMEKLCKRWRETGQWSRLNARKPIFVEPRGGSQEDLESTLKGYYSSIRKGTKPTLGKRRKAKKVDPNCCSETDSLDVCKQGAAFLAVCRGKVSEGIDFSDENARAVIIVGIPFPNIYDIQVAEKKKYNDTFKLAKNLLSGSDWYCQQAFRALNQAAGRCIRHSSDYGAIIFLDERFREERNTIYISKWLRKSIKIYDNLETSVKELKSFFSNIKVATVNASTPCEPAVDLKNIAVDNSSKRSVKQRSQYQYESQVVEERTTLRHLSMTLPISHCSLKPETASGYLATRPEGSTEVLEPSSAHHPDDIDCQNKNGSFCNSLEELSCLGVPCSISLEDGADQIVVKETLAPRNCAIATPEANMSDEADHIVVKETPVARNCTITTPEDSMSDDNSHSTIAQNSFDYGQANHVPLMSGARSSSELTYFDTTPERNAREQSKALAQDMETSGNLSVNSRAQKRRAVVNPPVANLLQEMKFAMATPEVPQDHRSRAYLVKSDSSNQRTDLSVSMSSSKCELMSNVLISSVACNATGSLSGDLPLNQQLQIFCSLCRNPLGVPENNLVVSCSSTSLMKRILTTLFESKGQQSVQTSPTASRVLIVDKLSVDQRLWNRNNEDIPGQGIWCKEDGCVYNTIFCPFCSSLGHCLGVQIMAADTSNIHLIEKVLFYYDRLVVKANQEQERKVYSTGNGSSPTQTFDISSIGKYAYQSPQQNSGGWRMTKAKLKSQKKSSVSQC